MDTAAKAAREEARKKTSKPGDKQTNTRQVALFQKFLRDDLAQIMTGMSGYSKVPTPLSLPLICFQHQGGVIAGLLLT